MTVKQLLEKGVQLLTESGIDNARNETRWIFESAFECGRDYSVLYGNSEADSEKAERFLRMTAERQGGLPVQYVIGEWDFYGETFKVGEGVLIPRPETEMLVDFALGYLKDKQNPVVFDLCAGSGCIGLSVAKNRPDAKVYLLEKSEKAFAYLEINKKMLGCGNTELVSGDLFDGFQSFELPKPDLILSNPPYIESAEIPLLQKEVLREPAMALDGGKDGYDFYRTIAQTWLPFCKGAIAVECGENQTDTIEKLFSKICAEVYSEKDFNGIGRTVCGFAGTERVQYVT